MKYGLLIYGDEDAWDSWTPERQKAEVQAYDVYTRSIVEAGIMQGGAELRSTPTATTVRVRGGERLVTDGPFAETKEQLGGFYLIECDTLDEAIDAAARIPTAIWGSIEIRPLVEHPAE